MKNRLLLIFSVFALVTAAILILFFILIETVYVFTENERLNLIILFSILAFVNVTIFITSYLIIKQKREEIRNTFDYYVEHEISQSGVGIIIFNSDLYIIWASSFIEERIGMIIGKKIFAISEDFKQRYESGKETFRLEINGVIFDVKINLEKKCLILKDVTNENMVLNQYVSEKLVLGELEIDNFQQFQVTLTEEELFKVQSKVIEMFDELGRNQNLIYRQYVNGKFIFFMNQNTLDYFIKSKFEFIDNLRDNRIRSGINLTVSIGLGTGTSLLKDLAELAREGLSQAQSRGGDQVALMFAREKPQYFGSKIEKKQTMSKIKIKQIAELLESKLKQSRIKNVIVYGHRDADLDAVGAAMGIVELAHNYEKKAYIQNVTFDLTTSTVIAKYFSKQEQQLFIKPTKAIKETSENSIIIIVDTSEFNRIENTSALKNVKPENVFIFDHHLVSKLPQEIPISNIYIDTNSSSASEIVTEICNFTKLNIKLSLTAAQMMLNGIYLDSQNFIKSTSARTYQAASYLEQTGAQSALAAEVLKIPAEYSELIHNIVAKIEEVKPGYFIAVYEGEVQADIVSKAANEILRTQKRKAAFVIAKIPGKQGYKLSARGIETNVQKIAEAVGGGGNFSAAAAISNEPLMVFVDNIRQAIVSDKGA